MKVCLFGNYKKEYSRAFVLKKGLEKNSVSVLECHTTKSGLSKFFELYRKHQKIKNKYAVLLIGPGGQTLVRFARLITNKPVVLDAFVSHFLSETDDRKRAKLDSPRAQKLFRADQRGCALADLVLLDTNAQIDYFVQTFKLPREKFKRLFVGADDSIFFPSPNPHHLKPNPFLIHWHGHIVPFHGANTIVEAAALLKNEPDIKFNITTRFDSKYEKLKRKARKLDLHNINFIEEAPYAQLAELINQAHVCLGIFGDNQKARVVIPNKIYEAVACAKPVITADHKVINEVFTSGENILTIQPETSRELADRIIELKNNEKLRHKTATNAYALYQEKLTPAALGKELQNILKSLL